MNKRVACPGFSDFKTHAGIVSEACCTGNSQCVNGMPTKCEPGCAAILLPMIKACEKLINNVYKYQFVGDSLRTAAAKCAGQKRACTDTEINMEQQVTEDGDSCAEFKAVLGCTKATVDLCPITCNVCKVQDAGYKTENIGCREPEDPLAGDYISNPYAARTDAGLFAVGTTMPMHCDSGYTASVADPSITCDLNGHWKGTGLHAQCLDSSSSTPTTATGCLQPLAVTNGENDADSHVGGWSKAPGGQYKTGMTVMLKCKVGYVPSADSSGSTSMLCQNTGLWDFTGSYAVCAGR